MRIEIKEIHKLEDRADRARSEKDRVETHCLATRAFISAKNVAMKSLLRTDEAKEIAEEAFRHIPSHKIEERLRGLLQTLKKRKG